MENLYQEWTLEDDRKLLEADASRSVIKSSSSSLSSLVPLAMALGRGLGGVQARLKKLQDVSSPAYQRLFVEHGGGKPKGKGGKPKGKGGNRRDDDDHDDKHTKKKKLVPVGEVLRRIQWDYSLNAQDFTVVYYDRVEETLLESPVTAPNQQIAGPQNLLVDALPEHRMVAVKYKRRVVWDRAQRLDLVFGSGDSNDNDSNDSTTTTTTTTTIEQVVATYDDWWRQLQQEQELLEQRRYQVTTQMRQILGVHPLQQLEQRLVSSNLAAELKPSESSTLSVPNQLQVEAWVVQARKVFRDLRDPVSIDDSESLDPTLIPRSDYEALNVLSEYVALLPLLESATSSPLSISLEKGTGDIGISDHAKRSILQEINNLMHQETNTKPEGQQQLAKNRPLPTLDEGDLTETFVRGSGPGGQKINKTANKVVLVHEPTQLRVECQETRSLQQNRKVARKRMRQKLDDYLHGSQSKSQQAAQRASKSKARAKNRARRKRKRLQEREEHISDDEIPV